MRSLVYFVSFLAFAMSPLTAAAQDGEPWRHPHHRDVAPKAPEPRAEPEPETPKKPEPEPYTVDPKLSPLGIQRWHPEAYDTGVPPERELEIEYVTRSPEERKRRKRIAIGVSVTIVAVLGIAVGTAVAMSNFREAWE